MTSTIRELRSRHCKVIRARVDERQLTGDFLNELLDQALRERLEAEFGPVRELIVAQAFSEANMLDPVRDDGDYNDDPLSIGRMGRSRASDAVPASR